MEPKFKVGDLVRIRSDADQCRVIGVGITEPMKEYLNTVQRINGIACHQYGETEYVLENVICSDDPLHRQYIWAEHWLMPEEDVQIAINENIIEELIGYESCI